ncbi:hypothetical protein K432DRAFT_395386 [Lepidopterella palustris CBS 459.81]|uniref:Uncharacterized protein n=1 Tax=Lepidopterella palustris CBS 459.81 TaxID=1314670 RepID=A0A8E2E5C3_9PEZI|nr:hypothetical protein K432DRAFT_395386 [Lepidopterella palustris CBS 459.81]
MSYKLLSSLLAAIGLTGVPSTPTATSSSRTLIVKPSATGRPPALNLMAGQPPPSVRVGGGGHGAKQDPSQDGSLSQSVGQMAEAGQEQQQQGGGGEKESDVKDEQVRRGDGQPLAGSDRPRNPKKRMWEEDVEQKKYKERMAEDERRMRDEL